MILDSTNRPELFYVTLGETMPRICNWWTYPILSGETLTIWPYMTRQGGTEIKDVGNEAGG